MIKRILRIIISVSIIAAILIGILQEVAVYQPTKELKYTPADLGLRYEELLIPVGKKVQLSAWVINSPKAKSTMLFFHGNAGNNSDRLTKIDMFSRLGLNIVIVDYRGFGKSNGWATSTNIQNDALKVYDFLIKINIIRAEQTVIYGESVGGVPAVKVAQLRNAGALILDSTLTSSADMARKILPFLPPFLVYSSMNSYKRIPDVTCPKLFIHSRDDSIIPYYLGVKLYNKAKDPKEFLEIRGDHNDGFLVSEKKYMEGIESFLRRYKFIDLEK